MVHTKASGAEPRHIGAADFKQTCLKLLDELPPEGVIITKRGVDVALVTPIRKLTTHDLFGILKGRIEVHGDIVNTSDLTAEYEWTADEHNIRAPRKRAQKKAHKR